MRTIAITVFSLATCVAAESPAESENYAALKVFIDCSYCDKDYLQTELRMASFVRDRSQCDVHIFVTRQGTGSGGQEYTLEFIGQNMFSSMRDTLVFTSGESDTEDQVRAGLLQVMRLGLVRYAARTDQRENIVVSYSATSKPIVRINRWKDWVFKIDGSAWFNGQRSSRNINLYLSLNAERVTDIVRTGLSIWGDYNEDKFDYDGIRTLSVARSRGGELFHILGINEHWSLGVSTEIRSSTYNNYRLYFGLQQGVEFSLFPYTEFSRRRFLIRYVVKQAGVDYEEETIFDKTYENLFGQELAASLEFVQPWGSFRIEINGSGYFHNLSRNRLRLNSRLSLRLTEGFSINISGSASRIRDQLSLPKGRASKEDVLLRRQELATDYDYSGSVGFSYSFGSIYNSVVNPRFDF